MESLDCIEVLERLCKATGKWGLHINIFDPSDSSENLLDVPKACSFLDWDEHGQIIVDGSGWFLFDTETECYVAYKKCVGDNGVTELNDYDGPVSIYAITCSPTEGLLNENT